MDQNEIPHDLGHLGVLSGASKMISKPMVSSAQTVHLSCIKISTMSKQKKNEHRVYPKQFLSYGWRKSCTYLALAWTLPPIVFKRDST
jgi:hypothetical protein